MEFINIKDEMLKQRLTEKLEANSFSKFVGIKYTNVEVGKVNCELALKEHHHQQNGYAHGGILSTLADVVSGFAAYTAIPIANQVVTGEIKVSYLRAGKGATLFAEGKVLKAGRKVVFTEAEVFYFNEKNEKKLVVKSTASMIVIGNNY